MTISPMCFGKQFALEPNLVIVTQANHFIGFMDEVRIKINFRILKSYTFRHNYVLYIAVLFVTATV